MYKELLQILADLNDSKLPYKNESGLISISLHSWPNIKKILKEHLGEAWEKKYEL